MDGPDHPTTVQIPGFTHETGAHCGSTSLRDLSRYYGWGFDEPTCFGLGSGVGFSFFRREASPRRFVMGRPPWVERAFFDHLEIPYRLESGEDWETTWADVRTRLDAGDPVLLFVDLYYLDYYDTNTHFAPHSVPAVGYDEASDRVLLADSEFAAVQALPLDRLKAAMSSEHGFSGPIRNRYLVVTDPTVGRSVAAATREAIRFTTEFMLDPASVSLDAPGDHGVPGLRAWAADVPTWDELPDASWCARFAYQNVERRGTGGGMFRRLYADFLDWASAETGLDPAFGERMHEVARGWTAAGEELKTASEVEGTARREALERAGERIRALAEEESVLYADLDDAV